MLKKRTILENEARGNLNKRGHLPTILLFIVALFLVLTAWFTFIGFKSENQTRADGIADLVFDFETDSAYIPAVFERIVERAIVKADKSNFRNSFETEFLKIAERVDSVSEASGNFFGKIRIGNKAKNRLNDGYELTENGEIYTLEIKDVFVNVKNGNNEIKKRFDLSVIFTKDGLVRS